MATLVSYGSELLPYSSKLRETGWCLETSLKSNVLCSLYRGHLKKKFECFQRYHNCIMEIQICFFKIELNQGQIISRFKISLKCFAGTHPCGMM